MKIRQIAVALSVCLPFVCFGQKKELKAQLQEEIAGKKAQIGIAVIINHEDTVTVNNENRYPMMSVFKLHQALSVADHCQRKGMSLDAPVFIRKEDLKPDTYSPLRDRYPEGNVSLSVRRLLEYTLHLSVTFCLVSSGEQRLRTGIYAVWDCIIFLSRLLRMKCTKT